MASTTMENQKRRGAPAASAETSANTSGSVQREMLHLRSLIEAPALIALLSGPDHIYEFVNERHIQVLGDRDYIGRPARDVMPEAIEQGLIEILDRVYATGEPFIATEMPLRFTHGPTGSLEDGFYNFIYQPLSDSSGAVTGIMIHAVNVTEEVVTRRRLEQLAAQHAATLSQMADGVIIVDTNGTITFQNEAARRFLAMDAVGLPVGRWLEMVQPLALDGVPVPLEKARLARTVELGELNLGVERRVRLPEGTEIIIDGSAVPVIAEDGSRYGSVITFRDITEKKRLEAERAQHHQELVNRVLQAQEDERKRIARELHDETVQDLTTLLINIDIAERHLPDGSDDAANALGRVRSIAKRALDEARALAHSLRPPILDDVGLAAALEALGEEYSQTYGVDVAVHAHGLEDTRLAPYVETVLFRVAQEALTNACKHAGGSAVRIRFTVKDTIATLRVEDDGRGFDLRRTAVQERHGGLGLSGMRERAALVDGDLDIDSGPGEGTRVTLHVPIDGIRQHHHARARTDAGCPPAESAGWIDVLLVDDHAMVREGLRMILERQPGTHVAGEAEDGRQALELVEQIRPDVVVMDIAMPNLNGLDATRQIKRRLPETKILILTSHEDRHYVAQIAKVGADGCLLKRSAGTELITALETVLEGRSYVSPSVAGMLLDDYRVRIDRSGDDQLTEREREVVQLVAEGHTNQGIARKLGISIKTVETHRANIMEKLGAADRTDLVKYAIRTGMITAD